MAWPLHPTYPFEAHGWEHEERVRRRALLPLESIH